VFLLQATSVNFLKALEQVTEYWSPRVIAQVNDQYVKVAKSKGQLAWHKHEQEDESSCSSMAGCAFSFEDKEVVLNPGDFCVVPKNTMHNPIAEESAALSSLKL